MVLFFWPLCYVLFDVIVVMLHLFGQTHSRPAKQQTRTSDNVVYLPTLTTPVLQCVLAEHISIWSNNG